MTSFVLGTGEGGANVVACEAVSDLLTIPHRLQPCNNRPTRNRLRIAHFLLVSHDNPHSSS